MKAVEGEQTSALHYEYKTCRIVVIHTWRLPECRPPEQLPEIPDSGAQKVVHISLIRQYTSIPGHFPLVLNVKQNIRQLLHDILIFNLYIVFLQ